MDADSAEGQGTYVTFDDTAPSSHRPCSRSSHHLRHVLIARSSTGFLPAAAEVVTAIGLLPLPAVARCLAFVMLLVGRSFSSLQDTLPEILVRGSPLLLA